MPVTSELDHELFREKVAVLRDPELRAIGARMRHERERLGYTVEEFALGVSAHPSYVEARECGQGRPSLNWLYWLALAGADVSFILAGEKCRSSKLTALIDALRAALR